MCGGLKFNPPIVNDLILDGAVPILSGLSVLLLLSVYVVALFCSSERKRASELMADAWALIEKKSCFCVIWVSGIVLFRLFLLCIRIRFRLVALLLVGFWLFCSEIHRFLSSRVVGCIVVWF